MSTAAEIMLRAEFWRPHVAETLYRWHTEVASPLSSLMWAHVMWRVQLRMAAESTRYQLTYTPKP